MVSDGQGGMVPADNVDEHGQCTNEAHPDLTICIRCARFYASDALVSWDERRSPTVTILAPSDIGPRYCQHARSIGFL